MKIKNITAQQLRFKMERLNWQKSDYDHIKIQVFQSLRTVTKKEQSCHYLMYKYT